MARSWAQKPVWLIGFIGLIFFSLPFLAEAAVLRFSPSSGTYTVNRNFTVSVVVDSANQAMNAADGVINFPTDKLKIIDLSKNASIFNLWVQEPSYSNNGSGIGNARFEGVVLNPGFTGSNGKILNITFQPIRAGTATVSFARGSVLANDGNGTNILTSLGTATYTFQVSAESLPGLPPTPQLKHFIRNDIGEWGFKQTSDEENQWVNRKDSRLVWLIPDGVTGISVIIDKAPATIPSGASQGLFDNWVAEGLTDGIHYFHVRFINSRGAGPTLHYKIIVDTVGPQPFQLIFPDGNVTTDPRPSVSFYTTDALSGIGRYEMRIGDGDLFVPDPYVNRTYRLPKQSIGSRIILVRIYDRAGNFAEASGRLTIEPIISPRITEYSRNIVSPGESLVVGGTASPGATVEINLTRRGKTEIFFTAESDPEGNWKGVYKNIIPSGRYEIRAKQILENGAESLQSPSVYVNVNSLFFRMFEWLKTIGGFALILLIFLILLLMIVYYFWHKFRMLRLKLRREAVEAEEKLKYGMTRIREEITRHESGDQIAKDLEILEKEVEKEIKDIEKEVE